MHGTQDQQSSQAQLPERRRRNRKRSKRRQIRCPEHGCYLESVSPKRSLYVDSSEQLRRRGLSRKNALMLIAQETAVSIRDEWLEAFWCDECYETRWFHIVKKEGNVYEATLATREQWQQAQGVIHPNGNPSVGEFSRKSACMTGYNGLRQFSYIK